MKSLCFFMLIIVAVSVVYPQNKKVLKPEMIKVEGGTFTMGNNEINLKEMPAHRVTVSSFLIGKYEVTQELWESVMGCNPSEQKGSNRPVERFSWFDAVEFCNELSENEGLQKAYSANEKGITCDFKANGYRLPTEAEWEYAARGGNKSKGYKYSGSNKLDEVAWGKGFSDKGNITSEEGTSEVGKKLPNELGIYDMSGNVDEWCWDWYGETYYRTSPGKNPKGPDTGVYRVYRGGSWKDNLIFVGVTNRDCGRYRAGFRLVRSK